MINTTDKATLGKWTSDDSVFDKAEKAVKDVGLEKGLIYVFDMSSRVILYNSKESIDLLPFVKTKLGIK